MKILLVEDDPLLGEGLSAGLVLEGYHVDWVKDGAGALHAITNQIFDAIILDLGLPEIPGTEVLAYVRASGLATPVLILTANDDMAMRIESLDGGADDYLTKPFNLAEVCARLRVLKRRRGARNPLLKVGDVLMEPATRRLERAGQTIALSGREFSLLQLLLENAGQVLTRQALEQQLYGYDSDVESNTLEVHIHHIRKKLGGGLIRTIRGIGYMVDVEQSTP